MHSFPENKTKVHPVSELLAVHYSHKFSQYGCSSQGVDWGPDQGKLELRYAKMLDVMAGESLAAVPSLLDVGCGFGGLNTYARAAGPKIHYTGIDVASNMIEWAQTHQPDGTYICEDVLNWPQDSQFDYVTCNGILTQKLDVPGQSMDEFALSLIKRMFAICKRGIAFNVMSTHVNYFANNLYYRNPTELLSWCMCELTTRAKLDHAYPLYEFTIYLYKEAQPNEASMILRPSPARGNP